MQTSIRAKAEQQSRTRKYVEASKAENTRRSYASHLRDFKDFCTERGYSALPAPAEAVVDYLTYLADIGAKYSTIQLKASAISYAHRKRTLSNPIKTIEVQEAMRGIRRVLGLAQHGKEPLLLADLRRVIAELPEGIRGDRDKAILLVGFGGAFRRSELVGLSVADVRFERDRATIHLRQSKTDQEGHGMTKILPELKDKSVCPVTALKHWLHTAGIKDGVIFRPITRFGIVQNRIMNPQEVARIIKKYATLAGMDYKVLAGHSLRAGYVTEAVDHDQPLWKIKQQTGHKSDVVLQRYIRDQGRGGIDATRSVFDDA
ncbi:MAG TPA: tyrosine-type recombinase/integrase [Anaerolineae bacterium]